MELDQTIRQTRIQVVSGGDIRTEEADALIAAVNSKGRWTGGIDRAIQSVAGNMYHQQAAAALPLHHCQTVVARGSRSQHRGAFDNVVFVIDDLQSPLRQVVRAGLQAADSAGMHTVTIPGIRLGVMIGVLEKSMAEVYEETEAGITGYFRHHSSTNLRHVKYVLRD